MHQVEDAAFFYLGAWRLDLNRRLGQIGLNRSIKLKQARHKAQKVL
jgi:hypothetical protein